MSNQEKIEQWIRIAGNADAIQKKKPPYWRYTLGQTEPVIQELIHEVRISGQANGTNMLDGMEKDASFLLWLQMQGSYTVITEGPRNILEIVLKNNTQDLFAIAAVQWVSGDIHVYGAPDLVREGNVDRWRCVVGGREFILRSLHVIGNVTYSNFKTQENVSSEYAGKYRQQWLFFRGTLSTDIEGNGAIEL